MQWVIQPHWAGPAEEGSLAEERTQAKELANSLIANIKQVIVGKDQAVESCAIALMAGGHILIDDIPGVGKTVLAKALARSIGGSFHRVQFTPDLLPSDITGVSIFNQRTGDFEFHPGPIMTNVLLTDEINRATPRTQSALLECMEERQITVDGVTRPVPNPFLVIATRNPVEYQGIFPLPDSQLDRFLIRVTLGLPSPEDEVTIMESQQSHHPLEDLEPIMGPEDIRSLQGVVRQVHVSPEVKQYIVELVGATRSQASLSLGASPRGSLGLYRAGQALAILRDRPFVLPDDIKTLAVPILAHRVVASASARTQGLTTDRIIQGTMELVRVPGSPARM